MCLILSYCRWHQKVEECSFCKLVSGIFIFCVTLCLSLCLHIYLFPTVSIFCNTFILFTVEVSVFFFVMQFFCNKLTSIFSSFVFFCSKLYVDLFIKISCLSIFFILLNLQWIVTFVTEYSKKNNYQNQSYSVVSSWLNCCLFVWTWHEPSFQVPTQAAGYQLRPQAGG